MTGDADEPGPDHGAAPASAAGPSPEDPNRFPDRGEPAPLDEAPDGMTPSDTNESARRAREEQDDT